MNSPAQRQQLRSSRRLTGTCRQPAPVLSNSRRPISGPARKTCLNKFIVNCTEKQRVVKDVPTRSLYTGARMPVIGLGTFGSDHAAAIDVARGVRGAYEAGYRHF